MTALSCALLWGHQRNLHSLDHYPLLDTCFSWKTTVFSFVSDLADIESETLYCIREWTSTIYREIAWLKTLMP